MIPFFLSFSRPSTKLKGADGAATGEAASDVFDPAGRLPLSQEGPRPQHGKRRFDAKHARLCYTLIPTKSWGGGGGGDNRETASIWRMSRDAFFLLLVLTALVVSAGRGKNLFQKHLAPQGGP